jgi:hypothetical protein
VCRLSFEIAKKRLNVVGIDNHYQEMNMGGLNDYVAHANRIKLSCARETAFNNCLTQRIGEKEQSLFKA